jgi:hypothetical protein
MTAASSDVQSLHVSVTETAIGGTVYPKRVGRQNPSGRRKDVYHGAWASCFPTGADNDVPISIQGHAIDASLRSAVVDSKSMQGGVLAERAIRIYGIGPQFTAAVNPIVALGNIQGLLVAGD